YAPNNIIKPRVQDWGTCLCVLCINPEMKLQKIIQLKSTIPSFRSLPFDIATIDLHNLVKDDDKFKNFNNELLKLRSDTITITFCEWIKQKHDKCSVPVSTKIPFTTTLTTFID
ncbi:unnamed protein product, partial [Didymodactylos carnosus]